tara:strand:+ start:110 stop:655 length:546 start_codon:yes stop_codon:yes gene_type:complete
VIKLIGLSGKARGGKDAAGDHIRDMCGFSTYAMAAPVKEACRVIFGWDYRHLHGHLKDVLDPIYNVTPRAAIQKLGTEFGRNMINNDIWTIKAENEIKARSNLVITDIRYNNEAELILENGGIIIDIKRRKSARALIFGMKNHSSEKGISSNLITEIVTNNGSLVDLYKKIDDIILKHSHQ